MKGKDQSNGSFQDYMLTGGFPEYLTVDRSEILIELISDILNRDIFVRHSLRNVEVYKQITHFLLSNTGKEISYHGLKNIFNIGSPSTVMDFMGFLMDAYLIFLVPRFDYSLKVHLLLFRLFKLF